MRGRRGAGLPRALELTGASASAASSCNGDEHIGIIRSEVPSQEDEVSPATVVTSKEKEEGTVEDMVDGTVKDTLEEKMKDSSLLTLSLELVPRRVCRENVSLAAAVNQ